MKTDLKYRCLPKKTILQNRYLIKKAISTSALSIIYLAEDLSCNQLCIVKEFFPAKLVLRDLDQQTVLHRFSSYKTKFAESRTAFFNEALILKELEHKNIMKYLDHFTANNTGYLVTKYYKGITLEQFIVSEKNISIRFFLQQIFIPVLNAVALLHRKGIIHRDLKPSNIIINSKNEPVIIDFGSAIKFKEVTRKNIFITPGFSPLEFYSETAKQGCFSDLYSLAATLYYYYCGKAPVEASQRVIEDPIENIRNYQEFISPCLAKAIMRNLSTDPKKRFTSVTWFKMIVYWEIFRLNKS